MQIDRSRLLGCGAGSEFCKFSASDIIVPGRTDHTCDDPTGKFLLPGVPIVPFLVR